MGRPDLSRRGFLKLAGAASAGLALTACGVKAADQPLATSTPPVPTKTPQPTSTATAEPTSSPLPETLRRYAEALGLRMGVIAETTGFDIQIAAREYNQLAVTIAWEYICQRGEGQYVWTIPDEHIRQHAARNGMSVLAMHVMYGLDLPDWLKNGGYSREKLIDLMKDFIRKVMERYKGQVRAYTVANEGGEPSLFWNQRIGKEYVEMAFQTARETDPNAILIFNDAGHETVDLPNSARDYEIVKGLKQKGLVDAVGLQMHILGVPFSYLDPNDPPTKDELLEQMRRYGDLGLKVYVSELDVDTGSIPGTWEEKLQKQAQVYATVVDACLESGGICNDINMWGLNDIDPWAGEAPYLFSVGNQPKPAYYAVLDVLKKHAGK